MIYVIYGVYDIYGVQVRSKIARGACDQPKAGCMGPVVSAT